ncbi:MAG TPA: DUF4160 domain-containing protein [Anaerolineales bacterium]|nr:DUF4160 domain-containing protein [Anaerolineales bacterium]
MSPTIYRKGPYRFFFNSREETRMHVHVESSDGKAKFWLEPFVALADFRGLKQHEIKEIQQMVEEHEEVFRDAWHEHFSE